MKGGSIASDAVTGLVSQSSYDSLTKNFTNNVAAAPCGGSSKCTTKKGCAKKKRGGSIASNAVTGLVSPSAYNSLTKNFTNTVTASGGRGLHKASCKPGCKVNHKRSLKHGGDLSGNVSSAVSNAMTAAKTALSSTFGRSEGFNVFKSNSAPAGAEYGKAGGFAGKNIADYMNNSGQYSINNRKGGSGGLQYGVPSSQMHGQNISRSTPAAVDSYIANDTSGSLNPAYNPSTIYGSTTNSSKYFNYAGIDQLVKGGKRKVKKSTAASKSKAAKPKPKAKKPKAKKA